MSSQVPVNLCDCGNWKQRGRPRCDQCEAERRDEEEKEEIKELREMYEREFPGDQNGN